LAIQIDSQLTFLERTLGVFLTALLVGTTLSALARLYVTSEPNPIGDGVEYAAMAIDPFNFEDGRPLRHRILTPLIAHYTYEVPFFPRQNFILCLNFIGVLFLGLIYIAARQERLTPTTSVMAVGVMSFSAPLLFSIHCAGYTDITSYVLLFMTMRAVRNNLVWPLTLLLALLNNENNLFVFPWFLLFYYLRNDRRVIRAIGAGVLMSVIVGIWYYWMQYVASCKGSTYSLSQFFNQSLNEMITLVALTFYSGLFQAFKLFWGIPVYAIGAHIREKHFSEICLYVLIVACAGAQIFTSSDTSRLFAMAFPAIWLGFLTLARRWGESAFQTLMVPGFLIQLFIPQSYIAKGKEQLLYGLAMIWLLRTFF
jgi:hypothetical protein